MKSKWIFAGVALFFAVGALGAAAQGPQGAGAAEAAQASSSTPHSLNPIKWVRKDTRTETSSLDENGDKNAKLTARLQSQGVLPPNATLKETCSSIKELGDCVAALHAGRNIGVDFDCLKSKLSGVQTTLNSPHCSSTTDGKPVTLIKAIHALQPQADAKAETKKAELESRDDMKLSGAGI